MSVKSKRTVVCLCGSTRFKEAFAAAHRAESLAGRIVLTVGVYGHCEANLPADWPEIKAKLDALHLDQIDMADEVLIINVNGYVGDGLRNEIRYAQAQGKCLRWLEPPDQEYA